MTFTIRRLRRFDPELTEAVFHAIEKEEGRLTIADIKQRFPGVSVNAIRYAITRLTVQRRIVRQRTFRKDPVKVIFVYGILKE